MIDGAGERDVPKASCDEGERREGRSGSSSKWERKWIEGRLNDYGDDSLLCSSVD